MSLLVTRAASVADLPEILIMIKALAAHHDDTAVLGLDALEAHAFSSQPWITLIVAEQRKNLIGYAGLTRMVQLQFDARGLDMHHLFVRKQHRGLGVGAALINACRTHATQLNCRFLTVGTHPDNHAAQEVYLASGFERRPQPGPRFSLKL